MLQAAGVIIIGKGGVRVGQMVESYVEDVCAFFLYAIRAFADMIPNVIEKAYTYDRVHLYGNISI